MAALTPQSRNPADPGAHRTARNVALVAVLIAVVLAIWGLVSRRNALAELRREAAAASVPVVTLVQVPAAAESSEIVLPGAVAANYEAPIYARTDGYVKQWYTDIGARVKAGQLLAELETPDVDDELRQAEADLATAQANSALSETTARRWVILRKSNSVSAQDLDDKLGDAAAKRAAVQSAAANVARLRQLQDFKRVVAPFDGVVTARLTDVGALVTAGTANVLFRVADTSKLRVYVDVPQTEVGNITLGGTANLTFAEMPGRVFTAQVASNAGALDPGSRTLQIELQLDNRDGALLPGGYTQVHFPAKSAVRYATIPVSSLLFRADGLHVATVTGGGSGHTGRIALKSVAIAQDDGSSLQVTGGIAPGDRIVQNPPDSAVDGEEVRIAAAPGGAAP